MACDHKFAKLKSTNHQNLAIRQILVPPKFPAIITVYVLHSSYTIEINFSCTNIIMITSCLYLP